MKIKLTLFTFKLLEEEIFKQCHIKDGFFSQLIGQTEKQYGFGKYSDASDIPSIKSLMQNDDAIQTLIETKYINEKTNSINGKYLYLLHRDLENLEATIEISPFYRDIYLAFIGFPSIHALIENKTKLLLDQNTNSADSIEKEIAKQNIISTLKKGEVSILATCYKGYYFSTQGDEVLSFDLKIDYEFGHKTYSAELVGLHDSLHKPKETSKLKYSGTATLLNKNLTLQLENIEGAQITLILYVGFAPILRTPAIRGIYTTTSTFQYPICGEALIAKDNDVNSKDIIRIKRYLYLQRRSYSIGNVVFTDTQDFTFKGDKISTLEPMIGDYKLWSFYEYDLKNPSNSKIYQSKFTIHETFKSELTSAYDEGAILPCWIWLTKDQNGNYYLATTAYRKNHKVQTQAMLSLDPLKDSKDSGRFYLGSFSGISTGKKNVISSIVIFERIINKNHFNALSTGKLEKLTSSNRTSLLFAHLEKEFLSSSNIKGVK